MNLYILDDKTPVKLEGEDLKEIVLKWGEWFVNNDPTVKRSKTIEGVEVHTVFLGIDHNFFSGDPLLFETAIFNGKNHVEVIRSYTWQEAESVHDYMVGELS